MFKMYGIIILLLALAQCPSGNGKEIIDMSYELGPNSTSWPNNPPFNMTHIVFGLQPSGIWLEYNWFATNEHRSTHVDAPAHFHKDSLHIHEIPLEHLQGQGVVLRAVKEAKNDSDYLISKDFILNWESQNGRIPARAIVLMDFGWGPRYENLDDNLIFNTQTYENISSYHFPGIDEEAMKFLITERDTKVIGTDTTSLDAGQMLTFKSHLVCAKNNVIIIENVANMHKLPVTGSTIFVAPLKLNQGSGAPARVFAILNDEANVATDTNLSLVLFACILFVPTYF